MYSCCCLSRPFFYINFLIMLVVALVKLSHTHTHTYTQCTLLLERDGESGGDDGALKFI